MSLIFGFDIGTTSIGFAVIDHDPGLATGTIRRLGVRIFPEARDPKGAPLNQERRQARLRRRQLRRRRERRRLLGQLLSDAGLLPAYGSPEWNKVMKCDPYDLRKRAFEDEALSPYEIGRAIYHLAKHRHFKGREIDEIADDSEPDKGRKDDANDNEKEAKTIREATLKVLKEDGRTLGAWLSERGPHERKRGVHATRAIVEDEFDKIWKKHLPEPFQESVRETIFAQRPVFWRKNTLGKCRFFPDKPLCPKGAWLSQQKRMLEKVNNLEITSGNPRQLDEEERRAILARLQTQASMTWGGVRGALKPLYKERGEPGAEKVKFNLEEGGDKTLIGNSVEAKLADIFGDDWPTHPRKQEIRDAVHDRLWRADYGEVGGQRVVILPAAKRKANRADAARGFVKDFGITEDQAAKLQRLKLPTGWEPYSISALRAFLPHLEAGERFGALVSGPKWEAWRNETFPGREQPTGEVLDRLPSPADPEERERIAKLRNPTVIRARNELRKVVNNLIEMFGKPDRIRVELARDVGKSKRQREEIASGIRRQERRRDKAREDLREKGFAEPSRGDVEKWLLWEESGKRCPYTGDHICFDDLFGKHSKFDVEHIWPRSRSLDNSFRNKTLCRKDDNAKKGNRTPFEYLGDNPDRWPAFVNRLESMKATRGGIGMSPGKINKRFLAQSIPDGFADRQLNDTGYATHEAVAFLKRLWPDIGPEAPANVQAVSGRVTAQLRKLWELNNILGETGEKTRADHRHHAIDALTVACTDPGMTQKLSRYWQARDAGVERPRLSPPWEKIRADAEKAIAGIVVSHRVRKKVSGPLHKETVYGDTDKDETGKDGKTYRYFVTRKRVETLSKNELAEEIRDEDVREIVQNWVEKHGGDPKKAFPLYPQRGREGPEIRKVRLLKKQQLHLMAKVATGYADLGSNHHMAIFRKPNGKIVFEVVSLLEASRRLARREPVVRRKRSDGARFVMSLSPGDALQFPEGDKTKVRIVESVWALGPIVMLDHNDAKGETRYRPNASSIVNQGARKLSVDPIGRVHPAND